MRALMYNRLLSLLIGLMSLLFIPTAFAFTPTSLTFTHDHHIITLNVNQFPQWKQARTQWTYQGIPAEPPAALKTCGKNIPIPEGWQQSTVTDWNADEIGETIEKRISSVLDRPAGNVKITSGSGGKVTFDGFGLTGRNVDRHQVTSLTIQALNEGIDHITIPVTVTQPTLTIDPKLEQMGIREVVTIGESDFTGSPINRKHNIGVGIAKFNGHLIPQGSIFSFNEVLGPVNARTGYRKELVIQGNKTLPDYGGGLCQVSSTAYRGPWEYGLPIVQRKNHSYVVSYYSPQGTDATIYPPNLDMKVKNDTPGALLIQSFTVGTKAYFVYYGTRDDRQSEVTGPFIWDYRGAPKGEAIIYGTDVPPGERKRVSERHDGMKVAWYRTVAMPGQEAKTEQYYSVYETRQLTYEVGVDPASLAATEGTLSEPPSWIETSN